MAIIKEILPDNPASRLLSILDKSKHVKYNNKAKAGEVWAKILDVTFTPTEFFPAYAQLFVLVNDAYESVIRFYPNQARTHAVWKNAINKCLQENSPYHHEWDNVKPQLIQPNILDLLQVANDNLAHYVVPTTVDKPSIEKLRSEFEELKESIINESSFSEYLKNFLINELEKIIHALDHFDLNGSEPINSSIYNIVSNVDLNNKSFSFKKSLLSFLVIAASSISIINDIADLPESLSSFKDILLISDSSNQDDNEVSRKNSLPKEAAVFRKEDSN